MGTNLNIDFLYNKPEKINEIARMIYEEFVDKEVMDYNHVVQKISYTYIKKTPVTIFIENKEECIGTISIVDNDLKSRKMYQPWIASLYIKRKYRNRGIGRELLNYSLEHVKKLGYSNVYLKTETAYNYYQKLGWRFVECLRDDKLGDTYIFKKEI